MKKSIFIFLLTILFCVFNSCVTKTQKKQLPQPLFDTLTNQVVFITDSSSKQPPDLNLNLDRLNFLDLSSFVSTKDSFVLRFFIDTVRAKTKAILQLACNKESCISTLYQFDEIYDGLNYLRSNTRSKVIGDQTNWSLIFEHLLSHNLLMLPDESENKGCLNSYKDGVTYSIQLLNFSGQRHFSYSNPIQYDSTCPSGLHFQKILHLLKPVAKMQ